MSPEKASLFETTFKTIVDCSHTGIVVLNCDGDIIYVNFKAEKLFGWPKSKLTGLSIQALFPLHYQNQSQYQTLFFADTAPIQLTATKKDGTEFIAETELTKMDSNNGEIFLLSITDITERLNHEATIKKQLTELKTAGNYLEQLAYISAHDIKNPIITLEDLTNELLNSKNLNPDDLQILKMQKKVIAQMRKTNKGINDILKLRQGLLVKENADSGHMPLGTILGNITDTLRADIENTGTALQLNLNGLGNVEFPYFYLQSAFYNLIANAIKYRSPERPSVITFQAKRIDQQTFRFIITDNGLGFDMAASKDNLFGIFKRFHPKIDGAGLGLHIVKSIVDAYGGTIAAHSEVDKGTTFDITLKNPILVS